MRFITVSAVCLMAVFGVACSQPSSQETEADLCTALAGVGTAVDQLKAIGPTSSIDEFNTALAAVDSSVATAKGAATEVQQARTAELETAVGEFKSAVGTISDDSTLMGASATVSASAAVLRATYDEIYTGLNCAPAQ